MTRIRVVPGDLMMTGEVIKANGEELKTKGNYLRNISCSAPSYNGQFLPKVRAIGNEANAASMNHSDRIKISGNRLKDIGRIFWKTDNFPLFTTRFYDFEKGDDASQAKYKAIRELFPNWVQGRDPEPGTDAFLMWATHNIPEGKQYALVPVGNNEWIVLIKGTQGDIKDIKNWNEKTNGWLNNLQAFLGFETQYEMDIFKDIERIVGKGGKVHLSGHSQGGIIAYNLYDNLTKAGIAVGSITTFGSPKSKQTEKIDQLVPTRRWEAKEDWLGNGFYDHKSSLNIEGSGSNFIEGHLPPSYYNDAVTRDVKSFVDFNPIENTIYAYDSNNYSGVENLKLLWKSDGRVGVLAKPVFTSVGLVWAWCDTFDAVTGKAADGLVHVTDKASDAAQAVGEKAAETVENVKDAVTGTAEAVGEKVGKAAGAVFGAAKGLFGRG